jgi:hypothetical protein
LVERLPGNTQEVGGSSPYRAYMDTGYLKRNRWGGRWAQFVGRPECPYLIRWFFETPWFSVRLHHWLHSDDARAFHDHPSWFITLVLAGSYTDVSPAGREPMRPGTIRFRLATHQHTVEVAPGGCWTLLLFGPHERYWGFWRRRGTQLRWVKSNRYFLEEGSHPCAPSNSDTSRQ